MDTLFVTFAWLGGAAIVAWVAARAFSYVFAKSTTDWPRANIALGAIMGFILLLGLDQVGLLQVLGPRDSIADAIPGGIVIEVLWWPIIGAVLGGFVMWAATREDERTRRIVVAALAGAAAGLFIGIMMKTAYRPAMRVFPLVLWPLGSAALGAAVGSLRGGRDAILRSATMAGLFGFVIGAWFVPKIGFGTKVEEIFGAAIPGALVGVRIALAPPPGPYGRERIIERAKLLTLIVAFSVIMGATVASPSLRNLYTTFLGSGADKIWSTVVGVIVAVGVSAVLFVGANKLFDLVPTRWPIYNAVLGGSAGLTVAVILWGNQALDEPLLVTVGATVIGAVAGFMLALTEERTRRLTIGLISGGLVGLLIGYALRGDVLTLESGREIAGAMPRLRAMPLIVWPLVMVTIGLGIWLLRGRRKAIVRPMVFWSTIGWMVGAFVVPTLGSAPRGEALLATAIAGLGVGAAAGLRPQRDLTGRRALEARSRSYIFLAPALGFIGATLVIPTIRTLYLSVFDARTENFIWLDNYWEIFVGDSAFKDLSDWTLIFSSRVWILGLVFLVLGLVAGTAVRARREGRTSVSRIATVSGLAAIAVTALVSGIRSLGNEYLWDSEAATAALAPGTSAAEEAVVEGSVAPTWLAENWPTTLRVLGFLLLAGVVVLAFDWLRARAKGAHTDPGPSSAAPMWLGAFLLATAAFAYLRGTLFNNLWWVLAVTLLSSAFGLAIAVLADRAKLESLAKSFIFMPMAISFVGAGIIWRFMYIGRPPSQTQTGVLNSLWVGLGQVSRDPAGQFWIGLALFVVILALSWLSWRGYKAGSNGVAIGSIITALPLLWLLWRVVGAGLGGFEPAVSGDGNIGLPIFFLQEGPFNNLWLMLVLIWIQTGFAMVIFSAAIKAVPSELIEASQVDGATEGQTFWTVVIPQIRPTITVVVTTLIVLVTKVFDIVKVMTNGNFDTQVLANEMWQRAFTELNRGLGAAVAAVLFLSVLPIMYLNIRNAQKEAAT